MAKTARAGDDNYSSKIIIVRTTKMMIMLLFRQRWA